MSLGEFTVFGYSGALFLECPDQVCGWRQVADPATPGSDRLDSLLERAAGHLREQHIDQEATGGADT